MPLTPKQQRFVGYYVYALVDPRTDTAFYIGKGIGQRHKTHGLLVSRNRHPNPAITLRVRAIRAAGADVQSLCLCDGLTEADAFAMERALLDRVGLENLANIAPGVLTWSQRAMLKAAATLQTLDAVPLGLRDALWVRLVKRCEAIAQGRCLTPPELTSDTFAYVRASWSGEPIEPIQVTHATA